MRHSFVIPLKVGPGSRRSTRVHDHDRTIYHLLTGGQIGRRSCHSGVARPSTTVISSPPARGSTSPVVVRRPGASPRPSRPARQVGTSTDVESSHPASLGAPGSLTPDDETRDYAPAFLSGRPGGIAGYASARLTARTGVIDLRLTGTEASLRISRLGERLGSVPQSGLLDSDPLERRQGRGLLRHERGHLTALSSRRSDPERSINSTAPGCQDAAVGVRGEFAGERFRSESSSLSPSRWLEPSRLKRVTDRTADSVAIRSLQKTCLFPTL